MSREAKLATHDIEYLRLHLCLKQGDDANVGIFRLFMQEKMCFFKKLCILVQVLRQLLVTSQKLGQGRKC